MTLSDHDRAALRARLEWLRLMGVSEVPLRERGGAGAPPAAAGQPDGPGGETAADAPPSPAQPHAAMPDGAGQKTLFGGETVEPVPARRARAKSDAPAGSPLAGLAAAEGTDPEQALEQVRLDIGDCRRCRLCEKRTTIVFGVGSPRARLMFVGEGPGADEDAQGEPFVGRAGQLLTRIIEAMGLARPDVYIANIVKCRPPENRTPLPDETATCSPFLLRQIAAIRPRVIVCLGTPAAQTLLGTRETITRLRGVFRDVEGIRVMPTFHPAYLLRNPAAKREVWEDMKQVMTVLQEG